MMTHGAPSPFSREGSRPEDGLGADFGGLSAPAPPLPEPVGSWSPIPAQQAPAPQSPSGWSIPPVDHLDPHPAAAPTGSSPFPPYAAAPPPMQAPFPPGGMAMPYMWGPTRKSSPYAIASLVTGILSIFVFVTGPVAVGLGIAGLRHVRTEPDTYEGDGQSIGGIVTGGFGTLILFLIVASVVARS